MNVCITDDVHSNMLSYTWN